MKKLFTKKPLWAVVFAAAAIFAVTFVGCSSDDPAAPGASFLAEEGQLVEWVNLADPTDAKWVVAKAKGLVPTHAGTTALGGYVLSGTKVTPPADYEVGAGTITKTGAFNAGEYYKVELVEIESGNLLTRYLVATADALTTIAADSVTKATHVLKSVAAKSEGIPATLTGYTVTSATVITGPDDSCTEDDFFKVEYINAGGELATQYFAGASGDKTLTANSPFTATAILVSVEAAGFTPLTDFTLGNNTLTKNGSFTADSYYKVEYVKIANGSFATRYCVATTGALTTPTSDGVAATPTHALKSVATKTSGASGADEGIPATLTGYTVANNKVTAAADTFTAGNWYKVTYITKSSGVMSDTYGFADDKNVLLTALATATDVIVTAVDTTAKYTKSDVYSD